MRDWLTGIADYMILMIHAMALLVVAFGTVQAFVQSIRAMLSPTTTGHRFHQQIIVHRFQ